MINKPGTLCDSHGSMLDIYYEEKGVAMVTCGLDCVFEVNP